MKEFKREAFDKSLESLALFWCPVIQEYCRTFNCSWCVAIYWTDEEGNEQKGLTCPVFQVLKDFIHRITTQWEGGDYYKIARITDAHRYQADKEVD